MTIFCPILLLLLRTIGLLPDRLRVGNYLLDHSHRFGATLAEHHPGPGLDKSERKRNKLKIWKIFKMYSPLMSL